MTTSIGCIHVCNAFFVESVFNYTKFLWRDNRNKLGTETVMSELTIKENFKINGYDFLYFVKNNETLLNAAKITNIILRNDVET